MSYLRTVARDLLAVFVTAALAILVEHYVGVKLAWTTVLLGSFMLVWLHELQKPIWMGLLIFWLNHKPWAILICIVVVILFVVSVATMKLRLPPDPKLLITGHPPTIDFPPTEIPIPIEKPKPTQKQPVEPPSIVIAPSYGDLKERAIRLSQEIMADLYRHGWPPPQGQKIDPSMLWEQWPKAADYHQWIQRRSNYFRSRFYERVLDMRNEFSTLHFRDEQLDDFFKEDGVMENMNKQLIAAGQKTFDLPIAPQTIVEISERLMVLANKIK
jgi:hypothetical protein